MRYTVRCDDEPMGHVEIEAPTGPVAAPLLPLPAFERIRPALDELSRVLLEATRRMHQAGAVDDAGGAQAPARPPEGVVVASRLDPELAKRLDLEPLHAAGAAVRRLHFTLHDSSGKLVRVRSVGVSTWPSSDKPPMVSVFFGT